MRKIGNYRKIALLCVGVSVFVFFGMFSNTGTAQSMRSAKPSPTPRKSSTPKGMAPKKSPAARPRPVVKPTSLVVKPTSKPTPKPAQPEQMIVTVTSARLRNSPSTSSETLKHLNIGDVYPVVEKNAQWFKVSADDSSGWVSNTVSQTLSTAKRGDIYLAIAGKYFKQQSMDFATSAQLYEFLTRAEKEVSNRRQQADLSYKRLLALQAALKKIPMDKQDKAPYKAFVKGADKFVVFSEPSAEYYVISDHFWDLHEKYKDLPLGEEIAWTAAQNPHPGECEGYINCYLFLIRATHGEYLNFYPAGKYSKKALADLSGWLEPIVADSREKSIYSGSTDISDRAEFNKYLTELRAIISKSPYTEKSRPLQQIKQLGEAYR
jgi:hypothetical protein